jgi:anti-anti-sigma factor
MEDRKLSVSIETLPGQSITQVLKLTGPFTLSTMFDVQGVLREQTSPQTLIDLSAVPYMDSAALGSLLAFHVSCQRNGRKYGLVGASDRLKTLFRVAGVDSLLVNYDSMETAKVIDTVS